MIRLRTRAKATPSTARRSRRRVGSLLLVLVLALGITATVDVSRAPSAHAYSYMPADPWAWCWRHRPQVSGWRTYWWNPGVRLNGYTTTCHFVIVHEARGFAQWPSFRVDWNSACREQYGWRSHNIFAPGWRYYQACYLP